MALKRVHVGFTAAQLKDLQWLAKEYGLDITNTIRFCVARVISGEKERRRLLKEVEGHHPHRNNEPPK